MGYVISAAVMACDSQHAKGGVEAVMAAGEVEVISPVTSADCHDEEAVEKMIHAVAKGIRDHARACREDLK